MTNLTPARLKEIRERLELVAETLGDEDREKYLVDLDDLLAHIEASDETRDAAVERVKELLDDKIALNALMEEACEYMVHGPECQFSSDEGNERPCTCGYIELDDRMAALSGEEESNEQG